ncbi:MAG: DUF4058 family protein [Chloroflexota bacterium]
MSERNSKVPASPFPGMDPYLEEGKHWRGFHGHLAVEIVRSLNQRITPKYVAHMEVHTAAHELVISQTPPHIQSDIHDMYPDVAILQNNPNATMTATPKSIAVIDAPFERVFQRPEADKLRTVHIYHSETQEVVTAIEILSPANKVGENLRRYQQKRSRIIESDVHLIEIDLLRGGHRPGPEVRTLPTETDYVLLRNSEQDDVYRISKIWPVAINEPLPSIPVPLLYPDGDIALDFGMLLNEIYAINHYHLLIDYKQPPPSPKLRPEMAAWWDKQQRQLV